MRYARDMLLRNVICLRAWVDLYHITFGEAEYITICVSKLYHIGEADISLIIHESSTPSIVFQKYLFRSPITEKIPFTL